MSKEPQEKKGQVLVQLTPATVKRLDARAKAIDRSRSWVIEHAAKLHLDRLDRDRIRREKQRGRS